jgi:phytoene dehydrogenase-like protein
VKSYASLPYFDPFTLKRLPRVVVIGSGIAGVICSLKLAQNGVKVTLIEKNEEIGGHARYGTVFSGHLRNPAFGAFVPGMYPNFMEVIEELKLDKVFLCQAKEFRQNLAFDGHFIQDPDPVEVARFLRDMKSVYNTKSGSSQTIGMYLESQGYDEYFIIHFFIGKAIHFFAGLTIQEYLDIPLNLIAWFMVADMVEGPEASVYRLRNKEYMRALTCALQTHGVEILTGINAARLVARDVTGVRVNVGEKKLVIADKLVLAVPPSGAVDFLGYHMNDHEKLLTKFSCPQETVVLHQDPKWTAGNNVGVLFGLLPDAGNPLPSRQDTIPLTTTTVSGKYISTKCLIFYP